MEIIIFSLIVTAIAIRYILKKTILSQTDISTNDIPTININNQPVKDTRPKYSESKPGDYPYLDRLKKQQTQSSVLLNAACSVPESSHGLSNYYSNNTCVRSDPVCENIKPTEPRTREKHISAPPTIPHRDHISSSYITGVTKLNGNPLYESSYSANETLLNGKPLKY